MCRVLFFLNKGAGFMCFFYFQHLVYEFMQVLVIDVFCLNIFVKFSQGNCRASLDSFMNAEDFGPSLRSRGLLLQSAATAQSTMDFSTMAVDDGVVDSPVTHSSLREPIKSPSPVWPRSISHNVTPTINGLTPSTKRVLYDNGVDVAQDVPLKVSFYIPLEMKFFLVNAFFEVGQSNCLIFMWGCI